MDDIIYVGSSNLNQRSLRINYELMIRIENREIADEAREIFAGQLAQCRRIELAEWSQSHPFWLRLKRRLAY